MILNPFLNRGHDSSSYGRQCSVRHQTFGSIYFSHQGGILVHTTVSFGRSVRQSVRWSQFIVLAVLNSLKAGKSHRPMDWRTPWLDCARLWAIGLVFFAPCNTNLEPWIDGDLFHGSLSLLSLFSCCHILGDSGCGVGMGRERIRVAWFHSREASRQICHGCYGDDLIS